MLAIADYHIERRKLLEKGEPDPYGSVHRISQSDDDHPGVSGLRDGILPGVDAPELPDDPKQNLKWEREYLGFYLSGDPLDYIPQATSIAGLLGEDAEHSGGKRVEVVGVVLESSVRKTRKGSVWSQFLLQDKRGAIRAFSFGEDKEVGDGYVGRFKGQLVNRDEAVELKVFEFKLLEEW